MKILKRIGIGGLAILGAFTAYRYYSLRISSADAVHQFTQASMRDSAQALEQRLIGAEFPVVDCVRVDDQARVRSEFPRWHVILLDSPKGCGDCTQRELQNVEALASHLGNAVVASALFIGSDNNEASLLRKVSGTPIPILECDPKPIRSFNHLQKYPLILLLKSQEVVDVLVPIFSDPAYSSDRYAEFKRLISNGGG